MRRLAAILSKFSKMFRSSRPRLSLFVRDMADSLCRLLLLTKLFCRLAAPSTAALEQRAVTNPAPVGLLLLLATLGLAAES